MKNLDVLAFFIAIMFLYACGGGENKESEPIDVNEPLEEVGDYEQMKAVEEAKANLDYKMTAEMNDAAWKSVTVNKKDSAGTITIEAKGIVVGEDSIAVPATLRIVLIGAKMDTLKNGETFEFAPNTTETAAFAEITSDASAYRFSTTGDDVAKGVLKLDKVENGKLSGNFSFEVQTKRGTTIKIDEGKFEGI